MKKNSLSLIFLILITIGLIGFVSADCSSSYSSQSPISSIYGRTMTTNEMQYLVDRIIEEGGAEAIAWFPWHTTFKSSQYKEQHCKLYDISTQIIPEWIAENSPNKPDGC